MKIDVKKVLAILTSIVTIFIVVVSMILIISTANARKNNQIPKVLGHMFFIVVTDSMTPDLKVGDFIWVAKTDKDNIKEGDYIVFYSQESTTKDMIIIHSVSRIVEDEQTGVREFYTRGIKEGLPEDTYPTTDVIGLYQGKSGILGLLIKMFYNGRNIIMLALIGVFVMIAISQIKKIISEINKEKLKKEIDSKEIFDVRELIEKEQELIKEKIAELERKKDDRLFNVKSENYNKEKSEKNDDLHQIDDI